MQNAVFLPHGAPDFALSTGQAAGALRQFFDHRPLPRGIVIVSAHWETDGVQITTAPRLDTVHDFMGFDPALHQLRYPARTADWLINATIEALKTAGVEALAAPSRGLDHGAWVPLMLLRPEADIPVVQLSLPATGTAQDVFDLGAPLARLAAEDILVIGSGATVHNLRRLAPEGTAPPDWAVTFDDWLAKVLTARDWTRLCAFHSTPLGRMAHPTPEHLWPLLLIAGISAAQPSGHLKPLHRSYSYGSIGMSAWGVQP